MNDEQLARALKSIGLKCFVTYYGRFDVDTLRRETAYTEKSCISRTNHANRIVRAGRGPDALQLIAGSDSPLVAEETRQKALNLLSRDQGSKVETRALQELLKAHADLELEMQKHPWVNNRNNPIAEIAENLVAEATGGSRVPNNSKGWDVESFDGQRIEVKSRRLPEIPKPGEQFGVLREPFEFHIVALLVFDMHYGLSRLVTVPADEVIAVSQFNSRSNGWAPIVSKVIARGNDQALLAAAKRIWF